MEIKSANPHFQGDGILNCPVIRSQQTPGVLDYIKMNIIYILRKAIDFMTVFVVSLLSYCHKSKDEGTLQNRQIGVDFCSRERFFRIFEELCKRGVKIWG